MKRNKAKKGVELCLVQEYKGNGPKGFYNLEEQR